MQVETLERSHLGKVFPVEYEVSRHPKLYPREYVAFRRSRTGVVCSVDCLLAKHTLPKEEAGTGSLVTILRMYAMMNHLQFTNSVVEEAPAPGRSDLIVPLRKFECCVSYKKYPTEWKSFLRSLVADMHPLDFVSNDNANATAIAFGRFCDLTDKVRKTPNCSIPRM